MPNKADYGLAFAVKGFREAQRLGLRGGLRLGELGKLGFRAESGCRAGLQRLRIFSRAAPTCQTLRVDIYIYIYGHPTP